MSRGAPLRDRPHHERFASPPHTAVPLRSGHPPVHVMPQPTLRHSPSAVTRSRSTRTRSFAAAPLGLLVGLLAIGCAEGGDEERPIGDVVLDETYAFYGVVGGTAFGPYPATTSDAGAFDGRLVFSGDSTFEITSGAATISSGNYTITDRGVLTLLIPRSGLPTLALQGAIGLSGNTGRLTIADRVGNVGLYLGSRVVAGTIDPTQFADGGDWVLSSLQVQFGDPSIPNPVASDVGRSFSAVLAGTQPMPGNTINLSGTGAGSADAPATVLTATGALEALVDGEFEMTLAYGVGPRAESRRYSMAGDDRLLVGTEIGTSNEVVGLATMMRERSAPIDFADLAARGGEDAVWLATIWTVFPLPTRSGLDAAVGTATFASDGSYVINASNNTGTAFSFQGVCTADSSQPGRMTCTETAFSETWIGTVDEAQETIVLIDTVLEQRPAGESPELNMIVLVRANTPMPEPPPATTALGDR
jgi:hypothetical protein